jgi:hypothetical protein
MFALVASFVLLFVIFCLFSDALFHIAYNTPESLAELSELELQQRCELENEIELEHEQTTIEDEKKMKRKQMKASICIGAAGTNFGSGINPNALYHTSNPTSPIAISTPTSSSTNNK